MSDTFKIKVPAQVSPEVHAARVAEMDARSQRRSGKNGLRVTGFQKTPDRAWTTIIRALVDRGYIDPADAVLAGSGEHVKNFTCANCGSSSGFAYRDTTSRTGVHVVTCGRGCRSGEVLKTLGVGFEEVWVPTNGEVPTNGTPRQEHPKRSSNSTTSDPDVVDGVVVERPALPFVVTTADQLRVQLPDPPPARIAGILPGRGGAIIIAQAGAGKTTLLANVARDLIDGTPFLGRQAVRKVTGRVALLSYEMDAVELIDWNLKAGVDLERLVVVDLRDVRNPLRDVHEMAALAEELRELDVEVVMVDTFGRAFTGESQDKAGDVADWFAMLNRFVRTLAGAHEWIVAAHAGWTDGRARGSSALHDNPDAVLVYGRDTEARTLRVEKYRGTAPMERVTVEMDTATLRLSAGDHVGTYGTRILEYVELNPESSVRAIARGICARKDRVSEGIAQLVRTGELLRTRGPKNAWLHSLPIHAQEVVPEPLGTTGTTGSPSGSPPIYRGTTREPDTGPSASNGTAPPCERCGKPNPDHLKAIYCASCLTELREASR